MLMIHTTYCLTPISWVGFVGKAWSVACPQAHLRCMLARVLQTDEVTSLYSYHISCVDCPYEGQVVMDCMPLCPTTFTNTGVTSCPSACVWGAVVQIEW